MEHQVDIQMINGKIQVMKEAAEALILMAGEFPALARNTARIMASIKMLEINVSDVSELESE